MCCIVCGVRCCVCCVLWSFVVYVLCVLLVVCCVVVCVVWIDKEDNNPADYEKELKFGYKVIYFKVQQG